MHAPLDNENKKALRDGFGEGMMVLGETNQKVVALCADLTGSDRLTKFQAQWPHRFVEVGVAEQNLAGIGAGMARVGKIPFTASFAVFHPGRSWDQIRVSGCYSKNNLKIYGGHAGITVGEDGATHQALEDVGIMRVLPNMTVICPADATQMKKATIAAATHPGPVYLRGGREKQPQTTLEDADFVIGKAEKLRHGKHVTIIAFGVMVREALLAAAALEKRKISALVLNMHTIKPLDVNAIIDAAHETGAIVTAEEHQVNCGLGSAVAEVLAEHIPTPQVRVGVKDTFGESGTAASLMDKYGLRAVDIVAAVEHVLERKRKNKLPSITPATKNARKPMKKKRKKTKKTVKRARKPAKKKPSRKAKKSKKREKSSRNARKKAAKKRARKAVKIRKTKKHVKRKKARKPAKRNVRKKR